MQGEQERGLPPCEAETDLQRTARLDRGFSLADDLHDTVEILDGQQDSLRLVTRTLEIIPGSEPSAICIDRTHVRPRSLTIIQPIRHRTVGIIRARHDTEMIVSLRPAFPPRNRRQ